MENILDIQEDDLKLDDFPSISACRELIKQWKQEGFFPNVFVVNDHGNVTQIAIGYNGYRIAGEWV